MVLSKAKYRHLADVPSISLPNGCNSLPPDLIVMLERFEKIYLWLDNDQSGREAAEKFANKLGLKRCVVVKPDPTMLPSPPKDANDALRAPGGLRYTPCYATVNIYSHASIDTNIHTFSNPTHTPLSYPLSLSLTYLSLCDSEGASWTLIPQLLKPHSHTPFISSLIISHALSLTLKE